MPLSQYRVGPVITKGKEIMAVVVSQNCHNNVTFSTWLFNLTCSLSRTILYQMWT